MNSRIVSEWIEETLKGAEKYETCMSLEISEDGHAVELYLDTGLDTYSEWIKGEGADICLIRCRETNKVVGCRLPLMKKNLVVHTKGPVKINEGFLKKRGQNDQVD